MEQQVAGFAAERDQIAVGFVTETLVAAMVQRSVAQAPRLAADLASRFASVPADHCSDQARRRASQSGLDIHAA